MKKTPNRKGNFIPCSDKNIFRIMKISALLLLVCLLPVSASTYSQTKRVSFKVEQATMKETLHKIEQSTEFSFFYNDNLLVSENKYTLEVEDELITDVLEKLLSGKSLDYVINDKVIVIVPEKNQQTYTQQKLVSGTVCDDQGISLPGVTIRIKGKNIGTTTDPDGYFEIQAEIDDVLIFSFIGMREQEVIIQDYTPLTIVMENDLLRLEEVVVTGVVAQTQRKKLSFTVEKINSDLLQTVPAANLANSLTGKVAGIKISNNAGSPGADADIQLRGATAIFGSSNPLIIIDGILTEGRLSDINSEDIESIEVVKGASASSLYGSRAANGVIHIKTKRGSNLSSGSTEINYRSEFGASYIPFTPEKTTATNFIVSGGAVDYNTPSADGIYDNPYPTLTDPVGQFFNPGSYNTNYLSYSTNSQDGRTSLFGSLHYTDEAGVVKLTDGMQRTNFRINADHWISDKIKVTTSNLYSQSTIDQRAGGIWDLFYYADPDVDLLAPNEEDGSAYNVDPNHNNPRLANPLYLINNSKNFEERTRFLGHYAVQYKPLDYLDFSLAYGIDQISRNSFSLSPKGLLQADRDELTYGSIYKSHNNTTAQTVQVDGFFYKKLGDFLTKAKLQYLYESNEYSYFAGSGTHLAVKGMDVTSLEQASEDINISSYESAIVANNVSGVFNLVYKDKYIFDALIRQDGVSLFGANVRWQTFYRMSGAWRVTEDFRIPGFEELKVRASYGVAGLRPPFESQYETVGLSDGTITSPVAIGNADLKPSFAKETELGLDASFLNRFSFTFNYAHSFNTDQILEVPVSATTGFATQWQNAGKLESHALEASLKANLINSSDWNWDITLLWDRITQKVVELNRPGYAIISGGIFRIEEGQDFGTLYGHKWATSLEEVANQVPEGMAVEDYFTINNQGFVVRTTTIGTVDEEPIKIKDDNGNDKEMVIGSVIPDFNMNLSSFLTYKNLELYMLWGYQQGGETYNHMRRYMMINGVSSELDQTGKPDNEVKSAKYFDRLTSWNNSHFVEDASYVKLRELSLNYSLKENILKGFLGIERIRLGIVGRNLLTLTKYSGFDPETGKSEEGVDSNVLKFDLSSYPNYATVSGTIQITF